LGVLEDTSGRGRSLVARSGAGQELFVVVGILTRIHGRNVDMRRVIVCLGVVSRHAVWARVVLKDGMLSRLFTDNTSPDVTCILDVTCQARLTPAGSSSLFYTPSLAIR
jgi:hypothetical protein